MKLRIGKDGDYLDLNRGTAIQIDAQSPIYFGDRSPDSIPSVKTYTFQIPKTPRNRRLLGDPARLDNPRAFLTENGWRIEFESRVLFTGILEVESAVWRGDIDITFIGGLAGSLNLLKEKKLAELGLHTPVTVGEDSQALLDHATYVTQNPDEFDYRFPTIRIAEDTAPEYIPSTDEDAVIEGPVEYITVNVGVGRSRGPVRVASYAKTNTPGEETEDGTTTRPTRYSYLNLYRDEHLLSLQLNGPIQYGSLAPMPTLHWTLSRTLEAVGYHLTGVFDTAPERDELRELILYSNYTQDQVVGLPVNSEPTIEDITLRPTVDLNRQVPDVLANDFIRAVCNTFAWGLFIDPNTQRAALVPYRDILADDSFLEWTNRVDPNYRRERMSEDLPTNFGFDYANDDDFPESWPLRTDEITNVITFDDTGAATFDSGFTTDDFGQVIYIRSVNEYFRLVAFRSTAAVYRSLGRDLAPYNRGARDSYRPELTTALMDTRYTLGTDYASGQRGEAYTPGVYLEPVTPLTTADRIGDIMLLLYRGLQNDNNGNPYPLATNSRYNRAQELIGDISLLWNQPGGIWPTWWQEWYEVLQRLRPVNYAARLTSRDLSGLDFRRKVQIDGQLYLVRRVQVTLTTERILPASVELMQLP